MFVWETMYQYVAMLFFRHLVAILKSSMEQQSVISVTCTIMRGGATIGSNVLLASGCRVVIMRHVISNGKRSVKDCVISSNGISISDGSWLASNVDVTVGVKIGKGVVVGAGAVVTNNLPDYSVCFGIPARQIRSRV